jgi:tetrahydromethanopterin S-methyltransferase subunit G
MSADEKLDELHRQIENIVMRSNENVALGNAALNRLHDRLEKIEEAMDQIRKAVVDPQKTTRP